MSEARKVNSRETPKSVGRDVGWIDYGRKALREREKRGG